MKGRNFYGVPSSRKRHHSREKAKKVLLQRRKKGFGPRHGKKIRERESISHFGSGKDLPSSDFEVRSRTKEKGRLQSGRASHSVIPRGRASVSEKRDGSNLRQGEKKRKIDFVSKGEESNHIHPLLAGKEVSCKKKKG